MQTIATPIGDQIESERHSFANLPKAHLEVMGGSAKHRIRPIRVPVFLIGSGLECDLVLGDAQFPEVHSYLFLADEGASMRWLGKGPALMVNDAPVQACTLNHGDTIAMAGYRFELSVDVMERPARFANHCVEETMDPDASAAVERLLDDIRNVQCVEQQDSVRQLLQEVRKSVYQETVGLRLYVEPDAPPRWITNYEE